MTPAEQRDAIADLHNKLVAYWHDVDFNWGRNAGSYYTEDAIFETIGSPHSYHSRAEIEAFYAFRRDRGARVNIHAVVNFTCAFEEDTVLGSWICVLYAHDGEAPQPSAPPIVTALVKDIYVRQDGDWLVARRTWHILFRGGVPGTLASREEIEKRLADKG
jgi:hypothetical protein